jgi:hypothetical protein
LVTLPKWLAAEAQTQKTAQWKNLSFQNLCGGFHFSPVFQYFLIAPSSQSDRTRASTLLMSSLLAEPQAIWKSGARCAPLFALLEVVIRGE